MLLPHRRLTRVFFEYLRDAAILDSRAAILMVGRVAAYKVLGVAEAPMWEQHWGAAALAGMGGSVRGGDHICMRWRRLEPK
jgi:hypothetical protein